MSGCGNPKGCNCFCGQRWHEDWTRPRFDIVCPMHDLGEECKVCAAAAEGTADEGNRNG